MDPRTARPVQGTFSVGIVSDTGTAGDALDDACFVLVPKESGRLLGRTPGARALFFTPGGTNGFKVQGAGSSEREGEAESGRVHPRVSSPPARRGT